MEAKAIEDCHIYLKEHIQFPASLDRKSHVPIVECRKGHWKGMKHLQSLYPQSLLVQQQHFKTN